MPKPSTRPRGDVPSPATSAVGRLRALASGSGTSDLTVAGQAVRKLGPMYARGAALRPRLRQAGGVPLVGRGVRVRNPQLVSVGAGVVLEDFCEVQGRSVQGIHLADGVTVGSFAMIRPSGYYGREPGEGLSIGARSNIGPYCYVGCSGSIRIGDDVMLGPGVRLFAEDHVFSDASVTIKSQGVVRRSIVIEDDCWLASGSTILSGVRIGRGSVVAAGAVVNSNVPPGSVVAGVPARVVATRDGSAAPHDGPRA